MDEQCYCYLCQSRAEYLVAADQKPTPRFKSCEDHIGMAAATILKLTPSKVIVTAWEVSNG